jgi:transposase
VLGSLNLGSIRGFLMSRYHEAGASRKPYPPVSMLKAQLLKHLFRVPSDRRLALLLKRNKRVARACGFRWKTPSHGLFTQFRHRVGEDGYEQVFSMLLEQLLNGGAVKGEVVALDGTAIKAYSQRSLDNKTGKSDCEARVGRGRRGFTLGYKVHAACCTSSELPVAFTVAPCNLNEKRFTKPLVEKLRGHGVCFETVLADAQYDSAKVRNTVREYGAEPVIPYRKNSKIKHALKV